MQPSSHAEITHGGQVPAGGCAVAVAKSRAPGEVDTGIGLPTLESKAANDVHGKGIPRMPITVRQPPGNGTEVGVEATEIVPDRTDRPVNGGVWRYQKQAAVRKSLTDSTVRRACVCNIACPKTNRRLGSALKPR